jgi:peptidyl-prolyl cis-trans isomerase B (cyclophilin B)
LDSCQKDANKEAGRQERKGKDTSWFPAFLSVSVSSHSCQIALTRRLAPLGSPPIRVADIINRPQRKGACPLAKNVKADVDKAIQALDLAGKDYTVELTTSKGPIRLEFFPDIAPGHVKNFIALAQIGFYDNVVFHRVIKSFMIQGGCPEGTGYGNGGYNIKAEFNSTKHVPGILSMARSNSPDSASTQFFIMLEKYPSLDGQYSAFGKVVDEESMKTVRAIGDVAVGANDRPKDKVVIQKAEVKETAK